MIIAPCNAILMLYLGIDKGLNVRFYVSFETKLIQNVSVKLARYRPPNSNISADTNIKHNFPQDSYKPTTIFNKGRTSKF